MRGLSPAIFSALFILAFRPTFGWLAERFEAADTFYSHGWLVPLASLWLIWKKRQFLKEIPRSPSFWGLALVVASLAIHLAATWLGIGFVSGFAMLGTLYGLIWTGYGWATVRYIRFPLLFLLFMIPLPGVLLISMSFTMKLFAASLATSFIRFVGIPALHSGSTIQVPGISVVVDDTCSGLRSLISLVALACLWTALMPAASKGWQKLTVVVASLPIALVANMVRIVALVLLSAIYGPQIAEGFIHYGSGFVVFGVALLGLSWLTRSLTQWSLPSYGLKG